MSQRNREIVLRACTETDADIAWNCAANSYNTLMTWMHTVSHLMASEYRHVGGKILLTRNRFHTGIF
jgi:hypothetical protein